MQMTPTALRAGTPQPHPGWGPQPLTDAAVGTRKARRTLAAEPVDAIHADTTVVAAEERARVRADQPISRPTTGGQGSPGQASPPPPLTRAGGCNRWYLHLRRERTVSPALPTQAPIRARLGAPQVHGEGKQIPRCLHQPATPRLEDVGPGQLWEDSPSWRPTWKMDCVSKTVAGRRRARASTDGRKLRGVRGVQPGFRGQAQGVGRWGRVGVGAGQGSRGWGGPTPAHAHSRPLVPPTPELTMGAGAALPAVPADAGEGVPTAHAGTPIHTGVGQAAAVLGCKGVREGEQKEKEGLSPEPGRPGSPPQASAQTGTAQPRPSPTVQVLPFQPGGQAQRKVSPLS